MSICPQALYNTVIQDIQHLEFSSCDVHRCAFVRMRENLLKKFKSPQTQKVTRERAVEAFMVRHKQVRTVDFPPLLYARGFTTQLLLDIDEEELSRGMRNGPGAVNADVKSTSAYLKCAHSRLTCSTEDLYTEYVNLLGKYDPCWYSAEILRRYHYGSPEYRNHSRLETVPKDNAIDRVIAVEPIVNAIMQQGLAACLTVRLQSVGINLSSQPNHNRHFARLGSLGHGFATVDFSAASDYLSRDLVRKVLPEQWSSYLEFVATDSILVRGVEEQGNIRYSMGNATTFPLQTLVFLSLVCEVYSRRGIPLAVNRNVAVFGDDVVIREDCAQDFLDLAEACGLIPNRSKTYTTGEFRESCGADWFRGINVRPVFVRKLTTIPDVFVVRNMIAAWYKRWSIYENAALSMLDDHLRAKRHLLFVPMGAPLDSGVRSEICKHGYLNSNLSWQYRRLESHGVRRSARAFLAVHPGFAVLGHLCGGLVSGSIQERSRQRYRRVLRVEANWPYVNADDFWFYDCSRTTGGCLHL